MAKSKGREARIEALELALKEARGAKNTGSALSAARALVSTRGAAKDHAALARLLLQTGDAMAALDALNEAGGEPERFQPLLRARILDKLDRPDDAAEAARWAVELDGESEAATRLRLDLLERQDPEAAAIEAADALARLPNSFPVHEIILKRIADPVSRKPLREQALESLDALAARAENKEPALVLLCSLGMKAQDHERLARWAKLGQAALPKDTRFPKWAEKAAAMADPERAAHRAKASEQGEDDASDAAAGYPGARRYALGIELIDNGKLDDGLAELETLQAELEVDPDLAPPNIRQRLPAFLPAMRAIRDAAPRGGGVRNEAFDKLREGPVFLRKRFSGALLVVFCPGITRRAAWTRYFSAFKAHQLFIDDFSNLAGLKGLPGLGSSPQENADAIKAFQKKLGAKRLVFYGFSIGGFSALLHGALAPADHVIACSPSSVGDPRAIDENERRIDRRAWAVTPRFERDLPLEEGQPYYPQGDLKPIYAADHPHPPATIFFSEGRREDAMHARRIAGAPDVRLAALEGHSGHWSDMAAIASGEMEAALKAALKG